MILLNFTQAVFFRVSSIIVAVLVCRNFNRGLRDVFYTRVQSEAEVELGLNQSMTTDADQQSAAALNAQSDGEKRYGEHSDED